MFLNQLIQFRSNNATNLHRLTTHSTPCCPTNQSVTLLQPTHILKIRNIRSFWSPHPHPWIDQGEFEFATNSEPIITTSQCKYPTDRCNMLPMKDEKRKVDL